MPVDRYGGGDEISFFQSQTQRKKPCRACVDFKTWAKLKGKSTPAVK